MTISILICEDQTLMRDSLHIVLDLTPDLQVIGEAGDGKAAVEQALQLRPDVILMDLKMPVMGGVAATAAITTRWPQARIIILTTFQQDHFVYEAIESGAQAYLLKDVPASELCDLIRRIHQGERIIQPQTANYMLQAVDNRGHLQHQEQLEHAQLGIERESLSTREHEVLELIARGASNREIADRLVLSEGTVKNYVSTILAKLHAANRTHATIIAREYGIV